MQDRETLVARLTSTLEGLTFVQAAWLGGSEAFGRADRFSDLDLVVVCPTEQSEKLFTAIEASLGPRSLEWRVPEPAWHGMRQRFYRLSDADPHHFLDLCVVEAGDLEPWLDPVRHGEPRVLLDRGGLVAPRPHAPPLDVRLHQSLVRFRFFARVMVERAVGRGRLVEAAWAWHGFVLLPLVELLRALHCPRRQDYGLRYTDVDLPHAVHAQLEALVTVQDLPDFLEKLRRAERLFDQAAEALVAAGRLPSDGRSGTW